MVSVAGSEQGIHPTTRQVLSEASAGLIATGEVWHNRNAYGEVMVRVKFAGGIATHYEVATTEMHRAESTKAGR